MKKQKIAVAMSGGVDSGVTAALLVKQGYKVAGFHLQLWSEGRKDKSESLKAARKTTHQLGIPFYIADFQQVFKKRVVDYFLQEYGLGQTPNPCVVCNRFIKFGELLVYVRKLGYDYLATGHYARILGGSGDTFFAHGEFTSSLRSELSSQFAQNGRLRLSMGKDKNKDQSYFLYNLTQKKLAQVMFPVGDFLKTEVVKMAKKWKLAAAERPESQEVCFFPEKDYRPFLKRQIKRKIIPGEVIDTQGKIIGKHQGIPLYTIGQRHGFTITDKKMIGPFYVAAKDYKKNQLIVGFGKEVERKEFMIKETNWISDKSPKDKLKCKVRIRHQGELLGCKLGINSHGVAVLLNEGERGVAPGQAAVFFQGEEVLGGGIIAIDSKS